MYGHSSEHCPMPLYVHIYSAASLGNEEVGLCQNAGEKWEMIFSSPPVGWLDGFGGLLGSTSWKISPKFFYSAISICSSILSGEVFPEKIDSWQCCTKYLIWLYFSNISLLFILGEYLMSWSKSNGRWWWWNVNSGYQNITKIKIVIFCHSETILNSTLSSLKLS